MNLYTSYFIHPDHNRQIEIDYVLQKNIDNNYIKRIYLLVEYPVVIKHDKVELIYIRSRPLYDTFFEVIKKNPESWNILANSDIYFDETLLNLEGYRTDRNYCFPLCRYEVEENVKFLNRNDSQDCWIFYGQPKEINGDFCMGVCGCDNAIAYRLDRAGYLCLNISHSIKSYHVHRSNKRDYNVNIKVPQPYKILQPINDQTIERL
jgi:hypothetical protein